MKQKVKEYLPLLWCKRLSCPPQGLIREYDGNKLLDDLVKYRGAGSYKRVNLEHLCHTYFNNDAFLNMPNTMLYESICDLGAMEVTKRWSRNKQVFKFDKDFTEELIKTENMRVEKDVFKFLPFETFYVDISDNRELCKSILGDGFFITVMLGSDNAWHFHICKVTDELYFTDIISVPNVTDIIEPQTAATTIPVLDTKELFDKALVVGIDAKDMDFKTYQILVLQILMYLSSTEPDIAENENTARTYRKPVAEPKNKYSEIQQWDVGVRFGTAVRSWRHYTKSTVGTERVVTENSRTKRPHSRRAHWHHFWYGKKDGERVLRPKWVSECFINVNTGDTGKEPVVVHKA